MKNLFTNIYTGLEKRPKRRNVLLLLLVGLFVFGAMSIESKEDISGFLPTTQKTKQVRYVTSNIDGQDKIIINLQSSSGDRHYSIEASECLVEAIDSLAGEYVESIFYQIDHEQSLSVPSFICDNLPYFIDQSDYQRLDSLIANELIDPSIARSADLLSSLMGLAAEPILRRDPLSIGGGALQKLTALNTNEQYGLYDGYLFDKEFKDQIVVITPRWGSNNTAQNEGMAEALQKAVDHTIERYTECDIRYFGAPLIAVQNATQIKKDSLLAITVSIFLILALMFYALRSFKSMILVTLPVVFGGLFALSMIWLIQGSISAIAIGAGSIIFGISISYSIHYVWHSSHCLTSREVIEDLGQPMIVGSLSTVGAFLSLLFINAESMRDFGLFAALSLVGSIVFVLIFLPHLKKQRAEKRPLAAFTKISEYKIENNRYIVIGAAVMTVVLLFFASRTTFSTDMQQINFMTDEQRADMRSIIEPDTSQRTLCVAVVDRSADVALDGYHRVRPVIESLLDSGLAIQVSSFGDFLPSRSIQQLKIDRWNSFWARHSKDSLITSIKMAARKYGFSDQAFEPFFQTLGREYRVEPISFFAPLPFIEPYLIVDRDDRNAAVMFVTVHASRADEALALIDQIHSEEIAGSTSAGLADGAEIVAFDQGSINAAMVEMLASDFNFVLYVCSVIVFVLLLVSFGRIEITLVAFLPMVVSWIWILGVMGLFGLEFNIINIILATFIFGLGDDFSIFITDGLMHQYAYRSRITDSHKSAVVLSSLTMLFGIGTLIFAKHPAMLSLGYVTIIGMFCVVVAAYLVPPVLFRYLVFKKGRPRMAPITAENFTKSIYSFAVFFVASILLTIVGFVLLTIMGRSDQNKLRFHKVLCGVARFVVRYLPMVESRVSKLSNETFSRGSIIVANHQSHLDLMYILALSPKIIVATNRWVWHSPFYGLIIRYADFFPVADGVGHSIELLRPMVEKGYSVVVFPEGTRSPDQRVHRFHKGAFYMARELGVEILPVVLHGIGGALPKQEFLLRHGQVTVTVMDRIKYDTGSINDHARQTKALISRQLAAVRDEVENCDYFARRVISTYIYKGVEVERQVRQLLKRNDNYRQFIEQLPAQGSIGILNCDIGVATLMAALVRRDLIIYATTDDKRRLTLAAACGAVPENLNYVEDISQFCCEKIIDLNSIR